MFYEVNAATPANTQQSTPIKTDIKLTAGIIHLVEIYFPPRCAGLCHVQIMQAGVQLYPRNRDDNIKGDGNTIQFFEVLELNNTENIITIHTWNESNLHPHTPIIRIGLLRKEELFPEIELQDLIKLFFRTFRKRVK